jgi:hypothetical protein
MTEFDGIKERIETDYRHIPQPDTSIRQADAEALIAEVERLRSADNNTRRMSMDITIGRTVHYTLSEQDAAEINRRRTNGSSIVARMKSSISATEGGAEPIHGWPAGAQAHIGNDAQAGQEYPAVSVRVWTPGMANLQVLLDGNDVYWATSRHEGIGPGTWAWPPRA